MINILLTILSLLLIAALTLATMYFFGDRAEDARREAEVTRMINASQQVAGALDMYSVDHLGVPLTTIDTLTPDYLVEVLAGEWSLDPKGFVSPIDTEAHCKTFNKRLGLGEIAPSCDDETYDKQVVCCTMGSGDEEEG